MIYNVALVDDETQVSAQMEEWIEEFSHSTGVQFNVRKFTGTTQFLSGETNEYHIIFMDINLPDDMNGLKAAKLLRARYSKAVIIFCTNYAQYALNGYEVGALSYLIKPLEKASFMRDMTRAVRVLKNMNGNKMIIKTGEGRKFIGVSDIVYIEVMVHNLYFHIRVEDGFRTERTRGSLAEVSEKLAGMNFARCSSCYLVNLAYVAGIDKKSVQLTNGDSLNIGRKYLNDFTDRLMRYIAEFGIIDV